jgi:DNA-binding CsgD family transcriptional regulator
MNKKLTATESRVLQLIAEQKKSKEIAAILFVSEKTIRLTRYWNVDTHENDLSNRR